MIWGRKEATLFDKKNYGLQDCCGICHLFKSLGSKAESLGIRVFTPNDISLRSFFKIKIKAPFGGRIPQRYLP